MRGQGESIWEDADGEIPVTVHGERLQPLRQAQQQHGTSVVEEPPQDFPVESTRLMDDSNTEHWAHVKTS